MARSPGDSFPGSPHTSSDLSDPPEFDQDEIAEIEAQLQLASSDHSDAGKALAEKASSGEEAAVQLIHLSTRTRGSRPRVPAKRKKDRSGAKAGSDGPAAAKKRRAKTTRWDPQFVTQNAKSPLVGKNLRALLLHTRAWDVLSDRDKNDVLALFPEKRHILDFGTPHARPDVLSLQNDDNFRHDTEEYLSNLARGMHDPAWLHEAWLAHGARASGQFDAYLLRKLEVTWKTKIPDHMKPEHLRAPSGTAARPRPDQDAAEGRAGLDSGAADEALVPAAINGDGQSTASKSPQRLDDDGPLCVSGAVPEESAGSVMTGSEILAVARPLQIGDNSNAGKMPNGPD